MSEWKECQLGEVMTLQRGYDLTYAQMQVGKIPVIGSNGIIGYHNKKTTNSPCVTIGRSGSIGNAFFYNCDCWAHNTVLYIKDFKNTIPKFAYYLLNSLDFTQYNAGSAVPTLNRNHIHPIKVNIPKPFEQKAIAEVLSSLDDKIDLLSRQNKTLEALASTYFRQWFIEKASDDWEEKQLNKLGKIVCGKTPSTKVTQYFGGNIPFIKIPDMHNKVYVFAANETLSEFGARSQANKTVPPFSINVSCIATVGLVTMNVYPSQTNQQINTIIPFENATRYFLFLFLKSYYEELQALGSGGTMTLNINTTLFGEITLAIPPNNLLKKFNDIVAPLFEKIYGNAKQINTLKKLRDTLLPKLISGEVRVTV